MWPNLHTPTMNCNLIFYKNQIGKILSFYVSAVKEKVSGFDEAWQVEGWGRAPRGEDSGDVVNGQDQNLPRYWYW